MQRRDFVWAGLWGVGAYICSSAARGDFTLLHRFPSDPGILRIGLERDMICSDSEYAGHLWCLPTGQWLESDAYAAFVRGRSGMAVVSVLDAGNHCLLRDALRRHGGGVLDERRQRISAGEWRYLLDACV